MTEAKKKDISPEKLARLKEKKRIAKAKLHAKKRALRKVQPATASTSSPQDAEKVARIKAKKVHFPS